MTQDSKPYDETVTVTFIANFQVDPDEFDLRVRSPEKVREELFNAVTGNCSIQEVMDNSDEGLERHRKRIKEARSAVESDTE